LGREQYDEGVNELVAWAIRKEWFPLGHHKGEVVGVYSFLTPKGTLVEVTHDLNGNIIKVETETSEWIPGEGGLQDERH